MASRSESRTEWAIGEIQRLGLQPLRERYGSALPIDDEARISEVVGAASLRAIKESAGLVSRFQAVCWALVVFSLSAFLAGIIWFAIAWAGMRNSYPPVTDHDILVLWTKLATAFVACFAASALMYAFAHYRMHRRGGDFE